MTTKNWNLTGRKPSTAYQQDWHIWQQDRPDIAFACRECSRAVAKATRADLTRLKCIGRYLVHTPRAVWEFPLQTEENIVKIDGLSDADSSRLDENETLDTRRMLARRSTHLGNLVVDTDSGVTEQRGIRVQKHGTLCE